MKTTFKRKTILTMIYPFNDDSIRLYPFAIPNAQIRESTQRKGSIEPKSVIRISLCRTAKRNPNDRFGINVPCQMVLPRRCLRSSIYRSALPRSSFRIPSLLHGGSHCLEAMFSAFFPAYGNFQLLSFN